MIDVTKINTIKIYAFPNKKAFLDYIQDKNKILIAINAEKILKNESRLKNIINNNIGYPDGVGAVMALKQKGLDAVKIPGAEFWLDIINTYYKEKSFYLLGSTQEVIEKTIKKLKIDFPGIKIIGYQNGFLNDRDTEELKKKFKDKKPDIVFVAQGSPKQEYLMEELLRAHSALYMGLGGSFDVYSGFKNRAPKIFLKLNIEWLFRLLKEPTRFKRQLVLVKFLLLLKMRKL